MGELFINSFLTTEEIRINVLTNIVKMLTNRKWIKKENMENIISELSDDLNNDMVYKINLDVKLSELETYEPNNSKTNFTEDNYVLVKLLFTKITGKSQPILDFLDQKFTGHKILVVDTITEKIQYSLLSTRNRTEIFKKDFLIQDFAEIGIGPKYEVLTNTESDEILESYQTKKKDMQKMHHYDAGATYYYMKKGQVVRLIRNSESSCEAIAYRMVK